MFTAVRYGLLYSSGDIPVRRRMYYSVFVIHHQPAPIATGFPTAHHGAMIDTLAANQRWHASRGILAPQAWVHRRWAFSVLSATDGVYPGFDGRIWRGGLRSGWSS